MRTGVAGATEQERRHKYGDCASGGLAVLVVWGWLAVRPVLGIQEIKKRADGAFFISDDIHQPHFESVFFHRPPDCYSHAVNYLRGE